MEKIEKRGNHWLIKMLAGLAACVMLLVGISLLHVQDGALASEIAEQTITVSDVTVNRGQEFDVDISIGSNSQGIQAIRLFVTFDPSVMTLVDVTAKNPDPNENWTADFNGAGKDADGTYGSYGVKRFVLLWVSTSKKYAEGTIATLRFLSKSSAAAADYNINVEVDPENTFLSLGENRTLEVSGGRVTMLPGVYSIFLYNAYGDEYAFLESNTDSADVTIEKALAMREGIPPQKASTSRYTYTFRGWNEVQPGDHAEYEPTYLATPVPYQITFKKGVQDEGSDEIRFDGANTSEETITLPYAQIINYDAAIPERFSEYYTFFGWYKDEACTEPVDFVTMPDQNKTVYGCFKFNVDDPSVTTTALEVETALDGDYIIATVKVKENYGINSLRFAPAFDATKLDFIGFLYESDSPFFGDMDPVFPEINDAVKSGAEVKDEWQTLGEGESIEDKHFLFLNANSNSFTTGKLLTLKYRIKPETASACTLGVTIGNRDVTRIAADGGVYYANATVTDSAVNVVRVAKPTETEETYIYNGEMQTYAFATVGGSAYYTVENRTRTAAGTQTVTVSLKSIENTYLTWTDGGVENLTFNFEILKKQIAKPAESIVSYTYNGNDQEYLFNSDLQLDDYTVAGAIQKLVGSYTVTVALKDDLNTEWADGTTAALTFDFVIHKKQIAMPTATEDTYTYTGNPLFYHFASEGDSTEYNLSQNSRTDAGTYTEENAVKVTLKDALNTEWTDGTTDALSFDFIIARKPIEMPTATTRTYTYREGADIEYIFGSAGESGAYTVTNATRTEAGTYTEENAVTVTLKDALNTEWTDGTTAPLTFDFVIAKMLLPSPVVNSKSYTGATLTADVTLTGEEPYELIENEGGVDMGVYDVVFRIKAASFNNYGWEDSSTDTVTVDFRIVEIANAWTVTPYVVDKIYDGTPIRTSAAAAQNGEVIIRYRLRTASDADYTETAPTNAGDYYVKFEVESTVNYDGLREILSFTIEQVRLTAPTATIKAYTYNGSEQTYEFHNAGDTERYELTGATRTAAGSQTVTASIKDKVNYIWKDGTVADKTFLFVIERAEVAMPVETIKTYVYTGSVQSYEFASLGDSMQYTVTNATRLAAGTQTVTVALRDKQNYLWADGSDTDLTFDFTIAKKSLVIPTPGDKVYIYNGNEQTYAFAVKGDTEQYEVVGDTRTEVGTQTVTVSIKDKLNYEWSDGTAEDKIYSFSVNYADLTATTEGEDAITVKVAERRGFPLDAVLSVAKAQPDMDALLARIASSEKTGALGQLTDEMAAALTANKCVVAVLTMNLRIGGTPAVTAGAYQYEVSLPAARRGVVAIRFAEDEIEVFDTSSSGNKLTFLSDKIGDIILLADHAFDREIAEARYLKSAATCEEAAVYYKSCVCGVSSEAFGGETFRSGEALGHDYDFAHILWVWSENHAAATAEVVCLRDAAHTLRFNATVTITGRLAPEKYASGYVDRTASFVYEGTTYSDHDREVLPANGHIYSEPPVWDWKEGLTNYLVKAIFTCDCGERNETRDATVTYVAATDKITYTAEAVFNGVIYRDIREIARPVAIFDFNDDGQTHEVSRLMLPGEQVAFLDAPARANHIFVGWRDDKGTLIVKDENDEFFDYRIGFEKVIFTAEWKSYATVDVRVCDLDGEPIEGATVTIYEGATAIAATETASDGTANFARVPYGNYKLVVEYPYVDHSTIIRTDVLDVDQSEVSVELELPRSKFSTVVEGDGSAEGLDGAISDSEKAAIKDGTAEGTINEIVITQKRVTTVSEEIKAEIRAKLRADEPSGKSVLTDFYDVTMIKTTTVRNASGIRYVTEEMIKVAEKYQTNIFPLTTALRAELAAIGGNADNIFLYKRHAYDAGTVTIYAIPKVSEEAGEKAQTECYFIKKVAGEEYIAIRQREYSVLALGVSPDPILLANEITSLTLADRTYGDSPVQPVIEATYGKSTAIFTYATKENGEYSATIPTLAGTYYLKAYIPAAGKYAAAEKITSFRILKKRIVRPQADDATYVYSGEEQVYRIRESADYVISGNRRTDAGKYIVTVALSDPDNTIWESGLSEPINFDFVIEKKKLNEVPGIAFEDRTFHFNGKRHWVEIEGALPEGVKVVYQGNGEYEIGKYIVMASFVVSNPNYEASEPMTAVMRIRLNWIPLVILGAIVLAILIAVIVIVEKILKKLKDQENQNGENDDAEAKNDAEEEEKND